MSPAKLIQELNSNYGLVDFHLRRDQEQVLKGQIWILTITIYSKKHWVAATFTARITFELITDVTEDIQYAFIKDMIEKDIKKHGWNIPPFDKPKQRQMTPEEKKNWDNFKPGDMK